MNFLYPRHDARWRASEVIGGRRELVAIRAGRRKDAAILPGRPLLGFYDGGRGSPRSVWASGVARGGRETGMEGNKDGGIDYNGKPFELDDMLATVRRAEATFNPELDDFEKDIDDLPESEMIASSPKMVEI